MVNRYLGFLQSSFSGKWFCHEEILKIAHIYAVW